MQNLQTYPSMDDSKYDSHNMGKSSVYVVKEIWPWQKLVNGYMLAH